VGWPTLAYFREIRSELLLGDASKAKKKPGWEPKTKLKDLVRVMMDADIASTKQEKHSS
jgi:GDPmannose 4,6-dehydratase